ncbi:hypothetical protein D3C87_2019690 [compost metagenome]
MPVTLPSGQQVRLPALPIAMDGRRFDVYRDLPRAGEHSRTALLAAGLSGDAIDTLETERAIGARR